MQSDIIIFAYDDNPIFVAKTEKNINENNESEIFPILFSFISEHFNELFIESDSNKNLNDILKLNFDEPILNNFYSFIYVTLIYNFFTIKETSDIIFPFAEIDELILEDFNFVKEFIENKNNENIHNIIYSFMKILEKISYAVATDENSDEYVYLNNLLNEEN